MNIFILDLDQTKCAQLHNNAHVVKMILESCQLLCSAHHMIGTDATLIPYKKTHVNHPCSKWTRESIDNYIWLLKLTRALLDEYNYRYIKKHKSEVVYEWCKDNLPKVPNIGLTKFAQAMPDKYKHTNPVIAYRMYYHFDKQHLKKYKGRDVPNWY